MATFTEISNGFTPSFVSLALSGITHRFILVLECESRPGSDGSPQISHPRFCVGGQRATLDPRNVSITELLPLASSKVDLPTGWEKVHQLIYVVQQNTDEHGWQYRSSWPRFALEPSDEQWSSRNGPRADVRRRLWMTTVVKRDEVIAAKWKIAELIHSRQRGVILSGPLLRLEDDPYHGKAWVVRRAALYDERIELYDEQTSEKVAELPIVGYQVKMLDGYAFSLRTLDGKQCTIFDTDSRETRRRWLVAITYQIAVRGPLMDFAPFPYAPPLGEDAASRTILCGDLNKKGQTGMNWKSRFFKLSPRELQYYDRDTLKGSIKVDGATVKADERTNEITIKSKSGVVIVARAPNAEHRVAWVTALEGQIQAIDMKMSNAAMQFSAEDHALTMKDELAAVGIIEIPSVAVHEADEAVSAAAGEESASHPLMSPFHARVPEHWQQQQPPVVPVPALAAVPEPLPAPKDKAPKDKAPKEAAAKDKTTKASKAAAEHVKQPPTPPAAEPSPPPLPLPPSAPEPHEFVNDDDAPENGHDHDDEDDDEDDAHRRGSGLSPFKSRKFKFGLQPDVFISAEDFGVEPELLTTAQKVAILESQAFQNKNFNPILPPAAKTKALVVAPSSAGSQMNLRQPSTMVSPGTGKDGSYVPTGLRMKTETLDAAHTNVVNDGGPVAKTTDKLVDKISKWEGWVKEIGSSSSPKR